MLTEIKLVKLDDFPQMDAGAPLPMIIADELKVILLYYLKSPNPYFDANEELPTQEIASITFNFYLQYKFGSPNDEALNGHKYYKYGLESYSFYEVQNSDYIDELEKINRVHPRHSIATFSNLNHFIGTFHESCLEIISRGYNIKVYKNMLMKDCLLDIAQNMDGR